MKHVMVFCYIFTILIGVIGLTIQWLASRQTSEKQYKLVVPFVGLLLVMNVYELVLYYNDKILNGMESNLLFSVGDCIIAALVVVWLKIIGNDNNRWKAIEGVIKWYAAAYFLIWLGSTIFLTEYFWIRVAIDVPLIVGLIFGSGFCIREGRKNGDSFGIVRYRMVITLFMSLNYISYFMTEAGMKFSLAELTVFYWLVINLANVIVLYRLYFVPFFGERDNGAEWDFDHAVEEVKHKFELTARETEILKEIYNGKTNTQIGETLFISESTVKAHIYNIFRKMGVKSRVEVLCAIRDEKELSK